MTVLAQARFYVILYVVSLSVAVPFLLYCFHKAKDQYLTSEERERRKRLKRKGQVSRAARRAGMSLREYSIRHFS